MNEKYRFFAERLWIFDTVFLFCGIIVIITAIHEEANMIPEWTEKYRKLGITIKKDRKWLLPDKRGTAGQTGRSV